MNFDDSKVLGRVSWSFQTAISNSVNGTALNVLKLLAELWYNCKAINGGVQEEFSRMQPWYFWKIPRSYWKAINSRKPQWIAMKLKRKVNFWEEKSIWLQFKKDSFIGIDDTEEANLLLRHFRILKLLSTSFFQATPMLRNFTRILLWIEQLKSSDFLVNFVLFACKISSRPLLYR